MKEIKIGEQYKVFLSNGFKYEILVENIDENFIYGKDVTNNKEIALGISLITSLEVVR
jgi:hypothetical protein